MIFDVNYMLELCLALQFDLWNRKKRHLLSVMVYVKLSVIDMASTYKSICVCIYIYMCVCACVRALQGKAFLLKLG